MRLISTTRLLWQLFCLISFLLAGTATAQTTKLLLPIVERDFPGLSQSLSDRLNTSGQTSIEVATAEHWHEYQQGLRAGRPGLYLAPPHFAAWAINQHGFTPLVRLATPVSYVIAARRNDTEIFEMNDLANMRVCAGKPLNLDYLLVNNAFDNSLLSADIKVVESVTDEMRKASSPCRAFSLTNQNYQRLAVVFPDRYIRLQQSEKFNNLVLIADLATVTALGESIAALTNILSSDQGKSILEPMLLDYAPRASWVNAVRQDYPQEYARALLPFWR